jgi:hypothetical protein
MTSPSLRAARAGLLIASLLVAAACAKDSIITPTFGAGCSAGIIRPGQTRRSALNEESCVDQYHFWSGYDVPYESHTFNPEAGRAYMVRATAKPDLDRNGRNGLYPLLTLWGKTRDGISVPRAVSDGDTDIPSELFFVAPSSASQQLVVSGYYSAESYSDLGGYELSLQRCPVLVADVDTGTTTLTLKASPCERSTVQYSEYGGETPAYNFITMRVNAGERISLQATATDFTPAWEAFGPELDTFGYLDADGAARRYIGEESRSLNFTRAGTLTLAIGAINVTGPSKEFTLRVSRTPLAALP